MTDKRVATFSRGMRQRLGLAEILMKDAQIAILDEPTSGLDPQATIELLNIIRELKQHGVSVLLSSHLLDRVQSVCDRVALFNQGNIALIGTVPELGREVLGGGFRVEVEAEGQGLAERIAAVPGVQRVETVGANRWRLHADRDVRPEAAAAVVAAGGRLLRLSVEEPSLEAIYTGYFRPTKESVMRREGSALHGFGVVTLKEIADHFTSILVVVLVVLVTASAIAVVSLGINPIKESTAEDPFLFLRLFTRSSPLPLVALLSFLVPLIAIGLGFDAVNGEHNRRTLSRILSQPIYRDALLFGKFVGWAVHLGGHAHRAVAAGHRTGPCRTRSSAQCRGNGPRPGPAGGDDRLRRLLVRARAVVLDRVPLRGHGRARLARGVAVRHHSLAAVLAGARQCGDRAPGTSSACWRPSRRLRDCPPECCSTRSWRSCSTLPCARPSSRCSPRWGWP